MERRKNFTHIVQLKAQLAHLELENAALARSVWFGCLTRNGLDQALKKLDLSDAWLLYFDVDQLKALNDTYGKLLTSALIKDCIKPRSDDVVGTFGQWFSGDEFVAVFRSKENAVGYAQRVQAKMHKCCFSATFIVLPTNYRMAPHATLNFADGLCNYVKKQLNKRNLIIVLE